MSLKELNACLAARPELNLALALPDGGRVPAHYHVTEVGHIAKKFVDCGGAFRASETVVLQTHVGSPKDDGHRLLAGKFARILDLAQPILPAEELPVEVEYEQGVIAQFPLARVSVGDGAVRLHLGHKHADCLAKEKCGMDVGCGPGEAEPVETADCGAAPVAGQRCC